MYLVVKLRNFTNLSLRENKKSLPVRDRFPAVPTGANKEAKY